MDSRIEKLDYVLDLVLKSNGFVITNDLYNSKFYNDKDNVIMESEFLEMVLDFKILGVAEVVNNGKGLRKNEFTDGFKKDGGFINYFSNNSINPNKINTTPQNNNPDKIDSIAKFLKLISENKLISGIILIIITYVIKLIVGF